MNMIKYFLLTFLILPIPLVMIGQPDIGLYPHIRDLIHRNEIQEAQKELDLVKKSDNLTEEDPTVLLYQSEIWIARANKFYEEKNFPRALKLYKKAIQYWPNHPIVTARYSELSQKIKENHSSSLRKFNDIDEDDELLSEQDTLRKIREVPKFYPVPEQYTPQSNSKRKSSAKKNTRDHSSNSEIQELVTQLKALLAELTAELQSIKELKAAMRSFHNQAINEQYSNNPVQRDRDSYVYENKGRSGFQLIDSSPWILIAGAFVIIFFGLAIGLATIGIFAKFASSMFLSPQIKLLDRKLRSSSRSFTGLDK
ncbi:MAG: tetratricopeptide repeat protein [Leptospira sp.]|nr:tetratricopeptide repeat protein [Leptospira sp.]